MVSLDCLWDKLPTEIQDNILRMRSKEDRLEKSERNFKVHLTPKFFFGRDETVQLSHKEFANFISMWYF